MYRYSNVICWFEITMTAEDGLEHNLTSTDERNRLPFASASPVTCATRWKALRHSAFGRFTP
jgi:hypothetical protein